MLYSTGDGVASLTNSIDAQKVHCAVGIHLGHCWVIIQGIGVGIGADRVLDATVSSFLTNANVVVLAGQVGLDGGVGEVKGLDPAGQALVVLQASRVGSVVGRAGNLGGFDFPHPSGGGTSESKSQGGGSGRSGSHVHVN